MHLYQKILNRLDDERGLSEEMAKISGYSAGNILRRVLKNTSKEFDKFSGLVKIVQALFPDEEIHLMSEYALTVDPNKKTARFLLEYCSINGMHEIKRQLLDKMESCKNTISKEWAEIYRIDDKYMTKEITFIEAIEKFGLISPKSNETNISLKLHMSYCYLDEQMYDMIYQIMFNIESMIMGIKEEFILDAYLSRYRIFIIEYNVKKVNIDKARSICLQIIDNSDDSNFKAWAYLHLGNSYILEGYEKAMSYYLKGLDVSKDWHKNAITNIKRSINFVSTLWNKDSQYFDLNSKHPSDIHEIVFYYIRFKQYTSARDTLKQVNFEELNENSKGFHMYLKGLISKNIDDFSESVIHFRNAGDLYFRKLPLMELSKLGVNESIIKALSM